MASVKILTLADGFGDSRACPSWYPEYTKWPSIIGLMTKGTEIVDMCRYGAGNEYITACLREYHRSAHAVFLQWARPDRLDLILDPDHASHAQWYKQISADPVYKDNFQVIDQTKWWLSSASDSPWVNDYHQRFISKTQHLHRSKIWAEYAHQILRSIPHGFLLTSESHYLRDANVDPATWIWHQPWHGMNEWRNHSQYRDLDLALTQPIPLIQFDFVRQFVMPKFDLPWRNEREIKAVENMLLRKYNQYKDQKPL